MKKTITRKLFLTLLLTSLVLVSGMYAFMQWSFDHGFIRYVEQREQQVIDGLVEELALVHAADGGWEALAASPHRWLQLVMSVHGHPIRGKRLEGLLERMRPGEWPPGEPPRAPRGFPTPLELRVRLLDAARQVVYGRPEEPLGALALHPIREDGAVVGYLGVREDEAALSLSHDLRFAEQQNQAFLLIALAMLLVSAGLALPLARYFVSPIRSLTRATRQLASGDYSPRIDHRADDELGQLARDFNHLAHTLGRNEALRRQWVADISHELRTPLAILRGEIEAVQDGVRSLDAGAVESLHQEVLHLTRLVDDLYELSMSDIGALDYRKEPLDLGAAARTAIEGLAQAFGGKAIRVETRGLDDGAAIVDADPDRLEQLLANLLQNTLRYTDPGGTARLSLATAAGRAELVLEDSAPGVSAAELPRLFDRLYRTEGSRNRESGGTGLGLAICRNIAEAHDGTLTAAPSDLGGLRIVLDLPLLDEKKP